MAEQKKSGATRKASTKATTSSKASAAPKKSSAAPKSAAAKSSAAKASGASRGKSNGGSPATGDTNEAMRQRMIQEAAYYRALNRGFAGAAAMDDWLVAEREIDVMLGRLNG